MARWTASAKWAAGPALDGQRDMPLALRLSEGLGRACTPAEGQAESDKRRKTQKQCAGFRDGLAHHSAEVAGSEACLCATFEAANPYAADCRQLCKLIL